MRTLLLTLLLAPAALAQSPQNGGGAPLPAGAGSAPERIELAGKPIPSFPFFQVTRTFNAGEPIHIGLDPRTNRRLARRTFDVYLLEHTSLPMFEAGAALTGHRLRVKLDAGRLRDNVFLLDPGTLAGTPKADEQGTYLIGKGYDLVIDADGDGLLGAGDLIDGSEGEAGFYVVDDFVDFRDATARTTGPYDVTDVIYDGGDRFQQQEIYFPTNIAALGQLPLIAISHGNGHNFTWYGHIGRHMASWGYVVMSHKNDTRPGIETASTTTLTNTELLLARIGEIAGGALAGHVDSHRIVWIGHSRGGEGVVRAYRRLSLGTPLATLYTLSDIKLVSSIAPTDFLGPLNSNMGSAPYHLWTGGADADVNGCADCNICQTFHMLERADGTRFSISLHGAGHGDFHDDPSSSVATGPCLIGRATTHAIMRAYLLPLVQYNLDGNKACLDYLTRQWEEFRATGAPDPAVVPCVTVDLQYVPGPERERLVIDDFQTHHARARSSSDGGVLWSPGLDATLREDRLDDADSSFTSVPADAMNGMTFDGPGDNSQGIVLQWNATNEELVFEVPEGQRDLRAWRTLSFRGAQTTRNAITTAELGDLDFSVRLIDSSLRSSTLRIGAYGGGLEEPYMRGSCGAGAGWANEFETIRLPLGDFERDGKELDLGDVVGISFLFGPANGSALGRVGLDEIMLTRD